jgi:catalase
MSTEDSREAVRSGTIEITSTDKNDPCDDTVFDPSHLADGIGPAPDEIFAARSNAYGISFSKRHE